MIKDTKAQEYTCWVNALCNTAPSCSTEVVTALVIGGWSTRTRTTSHLRSHSTWPQVWSAQSSVSDVGAMLFFFPPVGSARLPLTTPAESELWSTAEYCGGSWSYVGSTVGRTYRSLAGDGGSFTLLLSATSLTASCTCWSSSLIPAVYLLQHTV